MCFESVCKEDLDESFELGRVRLGSIRNKNNWNNASKRLFGSYSHSGIPGFHSGYSAPGSRIAGIYSGIHSYSGIFPNERALRLFALDFYRGIVDSSCDRNLELII